MNEGLSARSLLLSHFFDWLNRADISYAVMNNYEDMPRDIPSDVDIAVDSWFFAALDGHIRNFSAHVNAVVVQKIWHGNRKCAYILATGKKEEREFIQLDLFVDFSASGCPGLMSHSLLVSGRRSLRNFYTPRPEVEIPFIVMRRLIKNDWSERHCARIAALHTQVADGNWLPPRYAWLGDIVTLAVAGDVVTLSRQRDAAWKFLKRDARRNLSMAGTLRNLGWQVRRIFFRLRDETGNLSVIAESAGLIESCNLDALDIVFHRNLVIDELWLEKHHAGHNLVSTLTLAARIKFLKLRKGLIFVLFSAGAPRVQRFVRLLDRMGLADQILATNPRTMDMQFRAPIREIRHGSDVIEAITTTQIAKTERAMSRRFTQTNARP